MSISSLDMLLAAADTLMDMTVEMTTESVQHDTNMPKSVGGGLRALSAKDQSMRARKAQEKGARKSPSDLVNKTNKTNKSVTSQFYPGTALRMNQNLVIAQNRQQSAYSAIKSSKSIKSTKSAISKMDRKSFFEKLKKPATPAKCMMQSDSFIQRRNEAELTREKKDEQLFKRRRDNYKRTLDRITIARIMADGDPSRFTAILADFEDKRSNKSKREAAKLRNKLADEHFGM